MPEGGRRCLPSWAERARAFDLAWISENLRVLWPVARQGYEERGRGAIVVDTTQRPTGEGHPFGYFPQAVVEQTGDEDTQRMVREYDPSRDSLKVGAMVRGAFGIFTVLAGFSSMKHSLCAQEKKALSTRT